VSRAASIDEFCTRLDPEPAAVSTARHLVAESLMAWDRAALTDDAMLVVSELVTNSVLHAHTASELVVRLTADGVRIEVADHDQSLPAAKHYADDAATGRGLALVALIAAAWGIASEPGGKRVWVELSGKSPSRVPAEADLSAWDALEDDSAVASPPPEVGSEPDLAEVRLIGFPVTLQHRAGAHHDALIREFQLLDATNPDHELPARLVSLSAELTSRYGSFGASAQDELAAARLQGVEHIDITYRFPPEVGPAAARLGELLDEADAYCRAGVDLLTLATPADLVEFRLWMLEEITRQVAGNRPRPWAEPRC
jgi:anti-sigma regulatory factor (Ser/Thr protein kinase)